MLVLFSIISIQAFPLIPDEEAQSVELHFSPVDQADQAFEFMSLLDPQAPKMSLARPLMIADGELDREFVDSSSSSALYDVGWPSQTLTFDTLPINQTKAYYRHRVYENRRDRRSKVLRGPPKQVVGL